MRLLGGGWVGGRGFIEDLGRTLRVGTSDDGPPSHCLLMCDFGGSRILYLVDVSSIPVNSGWVWFRPPRCHCKKDDVHEIRFHVLVKQSSGIFGIWAGRKYTINAFEWSSISLGYLLWNNVVGPEKKCADRRANGGKRHEYIRRNESAHS